MSRHHLAIVPTRALTGTFRPTRRAEIGLDHVVRLAQQLEALEPAFDD
jgi:hypothetical protein